MKLVAPNAQTTHRSLSQKLSPLASAAPNNRCAATMAEVAEVDLSEKNGSSSSSSSSSSFMFVFFAVHGLVENQLQFSYLPPVYLKVVLSVTCTVLISCFLNQNKSMLIKKYLV